MNSVHFGSATHWPKGTVIVRGLHQFAGGANVAKTQRFPENFLPAAAHNGSALMSPVTVKPKEKPFLLLVVDFATAPWQAAIAMLKGWGEGLQKAA